MSKKNSEVKSIETPLSLAHDFLHEELRYDKATGELYWKYKRKNQRETTEPAGYTDPKGYIYLKINNRRYAAHRIIWCMINGEWPNGLIDHENQNPSDNRIDNLRIASRSDNAKNTKVRRDNSSGVIGVYWHRNKKRWVARINVNRKRIELGGYHTLEEAIKVRLEAEIEYGYHKNHGVRSHGS